MSLRCSPGASMEVMNAWGRIREVFEELVDLEPAERTRRLDALGADDAGIRTRVERLLAEDTADATVPIEASPPVDLIALDPARMRRVGSYEIVRVLGAGGMGTVFEARQARPQRTVALKVLRTLVASDVARRRLEYEAETLARLRHPNVAQIYESGTWCDPDTGEESPFFAMEFVAGARPLGEYADAEGLDLEARLRLFLDVCDAVHHGHQNGVLHRDLKPANLLVGAEGRPKVIDFGIARATDVADVAADGGTVRTLAGQVLGTLGYMSPEQLDADPAEIDVRADVYSLGATLYELLVGRTPHEKGTDSLSRFVERVKHELPPRPSAAVGTHVPVPPELDWIVLRALAADPAERYASVSELAADLRRFLADEPVSARPLTMGYLLRKFMRRHRLQVAAAAVVLLTMVGATIATAIGWQRAVTAEGTAERRREEAERLNEQIWEVTQLQADILRGGRGDRNVKLVDLLERARRQLEGGRPLADVVAASMHGALGEAYRDLGLNDPALEQFEKAEARLAAAPGSFPNTALTIHSGYARLLAALGRLPEAEAMLRDAVSRRGETQGDDHWQTALARTRLAHVLCERGDYAGADALYEGAIPVLEAKLGRADLSTISSLVGRANALTGLKKTDAAGALYDEACALARAHLGPEEPETLSILNTHAVFLLDTGKVDAARELFAEQLPLQIAVRGPAHPVTMRVRSNIALCHERQERYAEAEAIYRQALQVRMDAGGGKEPVDLITRFNLCVVLHRQDDPAKLEDALERLASLVADAAVVYPADNWRLAVFRQHRGIALRKRGRFEEAEAALIEARAPLETKLGPSHERTLTNYRESAALYEAWGRPDEAARWRQRADAR